MAMVAEREMPARQWTMTRQLDTLALSVEGGERKHVRTRKTLRASTAVRKKPHKKNLHILFYKDTISRPPTQVLYRILIQRDQKTHTHTHTHTHTYRHGHTHTHPCLH